MPSRAVREQEEVGGRGSRLLGVNDGVAKCWNRQGFNDSETDDDLVDLDLCFLTQEKPCKGG